MSSSDECLVHRLQTGDQAVHTGAEIDPNCDGTNSCTEPPLRYVAFFSADKNWVLPRADRCASPAAQTVVDGRRTREGGCQLGSPGCA